MMDYITGKLEPLIVKLAPKLADAFVAEMQPRMRKLVEAELEYFTKKLAQMMPTRESAVNVAHELAKKLRDPGR